ncbi:MAG: SDR family oxidoreductase [Deltaproteobacteria bacterium]|nr:SDR family oxidoreductase [Deltaproteobacteria bacterium]
MYKDLNGKTALVTGSGKKGGIGYAIARKLASCGVNIVIADMATENGENKEGIVTFKGMKALSKSLANEFNIKTLTQNLDVTRTYSAEQTALKIKDEFGTLDILCNNAGSVFGVPSTAHNYDEDAWMQTFDVNLHGAFRVSKAIVPLMTGKGGSIINTASKAAKSPPIFNAAYAVTKAGLVMLTKVMAKELAGMGIRVNAICPGVIDTDLTKWRFSLEAQVLGTTPAMQVEEMNKTIPLGRLGKPEEVANLVVFLASDESSYMTGQALNITGVDGRDKLSQK